MVLTPQGMLVHSAQFAMECYFIQLQKMEKKSEFSFFFYEISYVINCITYNNQNTKVWNKNSMMNFSSKVLWNFFQRSRYFRGLQGILKRTSRSPGVIKSIPRGVKKGPEIRGTRDWEHFLPSLEGCMFNVLENTFLSLEHGRHGDK